MTYRLAICDDEEAIRRILQQYIQEIFQEKHINMLLESYKNPIKLLNQVKQDPDRYHIIFLDIDMPELNGIKLGKKIKEVNEHVIITFITAHDKYALKAFEVDAFQYILKPVKKGQLREVLRKFLRLFIKAAEFKDKYITVKVGENYIKVFYKDIVYFEKNRNKVLIICEENEYFIYTTIRDLKGTLEDPFVQCHQGYIINKEKITEFKNNNILTLNKRYSIPVSRSYKNAMKKVFSNLLRG